jgi:hypothetical protein
MNVRARALSRVLAVHAGMVRQHAINTYSIETIGKVLKNRSSPPPRLGIFPDVRPHRPNIGLQIGAGERTVGEVQDVLNAGQ